MIRARISLARISLMAAALAVALPSCASTPDTMVLGLQYQPTSQVDTTKLQGVPPVNPAARVWINPVIDQHPEGSQIGVSEEEDKAPVYFGANGLPPADFLRAAVAYVLPAYGVPVAADPASSTHVLELKMSRFFAVERSTYEATITVNATLADRNGAVLWQGEVSGVNKRWGRTFEAANYIGVLSDAALDLGARLALDPAFRASASTTPAG